MCCSPWGHKESDMTERLNNKRHTLPGIHKCAPRVSCQSGRPVFSPVTDSSNMWFLSSHFLFFIKDTRFHISLKSDAQRWLGSYGRRLENS